LIKRRLRPLAVFIIGMFVLGVSAFAQDQTPSQPPQTPSKPTKPVASYNLGDQMLAINLGLFVPMFFYGGPSGVTGTNLSLGGTGSIMWSSFLDNNWALGFDVGGAFAFSPNARALFLVSITPRISYVFHSYPFDFPVFLEAGVDFARLQENFKTDPIIKPGASFLWNFNNNWAFGLNAVYWWIPQIYTGAVVSSSETRYGNFLDITLSALYHF